MASCDLAELALDCVIPAHVKDFVTLGRTVASIRKCCPEVGRIVIVSSTPWAEAAASSAENLDEDADVWPFRLADFEDCGCAPGWLLQQVLKLYAPLVIPGLCANVLVCDADLVWLPEGGVRFLERNSVVGSPAVARLCTFDSESCPPIRSAVDLHRYDAFVPAVLPGLSKPRPGVETAVCHHAPFQRHVLSELFSQVETAHPGQAFWTVFRDSARACGGRASEYELYHAFAAHAFPKQVVARPLAFAVVGDVEAAVRSPPAEGLAFLVAHSHLRGLSAEELRDREGIINGDVRAEVVRRMAGGNAELAALLAASGMF